MTDDAPELPAPQRRSAGRRALLWIWAAALAVGPWCAAMGVLWLLFLFLTRSGALPTRSLANADLARDRVAAKGFWEIREFGNRRPISDPPNVDFISAGSGITAELNRKFAQTASVDVDGVPLKTFFEQLGKEHGVSFVLDEGSFTDDGISIEDPISVQEKNVALRTILRLALRPRNLCLVPAGDHVLVRGSGSNTLVWGAYPVSDLAASADESQQLQETIMSVVEPDNWADAGGDCVVTWSPAIDSLTISATWEMHEEIREFLRLQREALRISQVARRGAPQSKAPDGATKPPASTPAGLVPRDASLVREVLGQLVDQDAEEKAKSAREARPPARPSPQSLR